MANMALATWPAAIARGIAAAGSDARPPRDFGRRAAHCVRVSSRGLGWHALEFERHDYQPATCTLAHGSRQHLVLISLSTGRMVRESDGERAEHQLRPGCVAVVPAAMPISWIWPTRVSFCILRLKPEFVDAIARSAFGLRPGDYRLTLAERAHDTAIANIAGVLAREAMRAEPGGRLYAESLASMLAVHLLRRYALVSDGGAIDRRSAPHDVAAADPHDAEDAAALHPRAVSDALAFIHANYAREVTLADMAQAVHLSPFHLTRVFKQCLGVSPHQYLIQVRVNSARWLLSAGSGERSLSEVATAVGFADQSHFTRHFKRATGTTPGQFRA